MTVLVTGASGFIGSWVVRALRQRNVPMVLTDLQRDPKRLSVVVPDWEELTFIEGDITQSDFWSSVIGQFGIDRIIHLAAWQIPSCRQDPIGGAMVNVVGTLQVFEAAKRFREQVKRIVYASSVAVFGPPEFYPKVPIPEDVLLKPATHYGAFKVCNELCANAYWHENGIPSAGLRPHTVYGFGRDVGVTADITRALKAIVLRVPFRIRFGGVVDLQYAADVAEAFVRCALSDLEGSYVYNLRGAPMEVSDIIGLMEAIAPEVKRLITFDPKPLPIAADLDDASLQRDVGPMTTTPVKVGFQETLEIFRHLQAEGKLDEVL